MHKTRTCEAHRAHRLASNYYHHGPITLLFYVRQRKAYHMQLLRKSVSSLEPKKRYSGRLFDPLSVTLASSLLCDLVTSCNSACALPLLHPQHLHYLVAQPPLSSTTKASGKPQELGISGPQWLVQSDKRKRGLPSHTR